MFFPPPGQVDHPGVGIPEDAAERALGGEAWKPVQIAKALTGFHGPSLAQIPARRKARFSLFHGLEMGLGPYLTPTEKREDPKDLHRSTLGHTAALGDFPCLGGVPQHSQQPNGQAQRQRGGGKTRLTKQNHRWQAPLLSSQPTLSAGASVRRRLIPFDALGVRLRLDADLIIFYDR